MKNKKMLAWIFAVLFVLGAIGIYIGNYFINFALQRGNDQDKTAVPAACMQILDPRVKKQDEPSVVKEEWTIASLDGLKLVGTHFAPNVSSDKWVIVVHGYGRDQNSVWDIATKYLSEGYHVLTPDLRASGKSEGIYLSMGLLESDDIKLWIDEIIAKDPQAKIILHGVSMGAATLMLTAEKDLPSQVKVLIEDCGYTSAYTMFIMQLEKMFGLPSFPIMNIVDGVGRVKAGYFISDAAPIKVMGKIKIPTLFIHGEDDELAPVSMVDELYSVATCEKEILKVKNAEHADARKVDADRYYGTIFKFINDKL